MIVEIDKKSGFCFGVVNAIRKAEDELSENQRFFCLGEIVHNGAEVERLTKKGMITITREEYYKLSNCRVMIRSHGEPPETYRYAKDNNIELIDATCPVVLKLQNRIGKAFETLQKDNGQLVIFGKAGHAEVIGLNGHTGNSAIIVSSKDDIGKIDFTRPVALYSQTTQPLHEFREIADIIRQRAGDKIVPEIRDTICRQVANRGPHLRNFATRFDIVVFVSGKKSSNGAALFAECKSVNTNTFMVSVPQELSSEWFNGAASVGICGATSTPMWLMEEVAEAIKKMA
jgi:4-hydroxy-3-methylbut-2-en-1-yl diphosphate reductase